MIINKLDSLRQCYVNMFNTLASKKIAILGFAFKANTGDTRESPAIYVTRKLLEEHAQIVISDPKAIENAKSDLSDVLDRISFESDPIEACKGAHAIAILTEWEEYRDIDFELIYEQMHKPAFIFDGRNILDLRNYSRLDSMYFQLEKNLYCPIHRIKKTTQNVWFF